MKYIITIILILITINQTFADQKPGSIAGKVVAKKNLQPLVGANVVIEGTNRGAATDLNGKFIIERLQPGSYNLKIFYLGYITVKKGNVINITNSMNFFIIVLMLFLVNICFNQKILLKVVILKL